MTISRTELKTASNLTINTHTSISTEEKISFVQSNTKELNLKILQELAADADKYQSANPLQKARIILGTSADPIHIGHFYILFEAMKNLGLSKAEIMPVHVCNYKQYKANAEQRMKMIELAIDEMNEKLGGNHFEINKIEYERNEVSYTADTFKILRGRFPNQPFIFLIGMDSLLSLHTWDHFDNSWYDLDLISTLSKEDKLNSKKVYIDATKDGLKYKVIGVNNKLEESTISWDQLPNVPQDASEIIKSKDVYLPPILAITSKAGHTYTLIENANFAVVQRPNTSLPTSGRTAELLKQFGTTNVSDLHSSLGGKIILTPTENAIDVSSSSIRAKLSQGEMPEEYLLEDECKYIIENNLYSFNSKNTISLSSSALSSSMLSSTASSSSTSDLTLEINPAPTPRFKRKLSGLFTPHGGPGSLFSPNSNGFFSCSPSLSTPSTTPKHHSVFTFDVNSSSSSNTSQANTNTKC